MIAILCLAYYLFLRIVENHVAFSSFFLWLGIILFLVSLTVSILPLGLKIMMLIGLLIFIVTFSYFLSLTSQEKTITKDLEMIVVFGAGLFGDRISRSLKVRLDKAYELALQYPFAQIIVTGGQGKDEWVSEASAMYDYLVAKGIDGSRIIKEEHSTTSYENLTYALQIVDFKDCYTALVSNTFHVYRIEKMAKKLGVDAIGIKAPFFSEAVPVFYLREYFAIIKALLKGQI